MASDHTTGDSLVQRNLKDGKDGSKLKNALERANSLDSRGVIPRDPRDSEDQGSESITSQYRNQLVGYLREAFTQIEDAQFQAVKVEVPRREGQGELSTNAAMVLARALSTSPMVLAQRVKDMVTRLNGVAFVEVVAPGFVNFSLESRCWWGVLSSILAQKAEYGRPRITDPLKINVEFVSANPTGPLHVAHARGAIWGDVIANVMAWQGHQVCREYYINDNGAQIDVLVRSVWHRYAECLGKNPGPLPADSYPGAYLVAIAERLHADHRETLWAGGFERSRDVVLQAALTSILNDIRNDLAMVGVVHDVFVSEKEIAERGLVDKAYALLEKKGWIEEDVLSPPKGQVIEDYDGRRQPVFRSTRAGDDVDRPLRRSDGAATYFLGDVGYHYDKLQRGFQEQVLVVGADHSGYEKRIRAAVHALSDGAAQVRFFACQLVKIVEGGKPVIMSKRAGTFLLMRDLVARIGVDSLRFIMLTRRSDTPLDVDVDVLSVQARENPVFYVQYAHARTYSVERQWLVLQQGQQDQQGQPQIQNDGGAHSSEGVPAPITMAHRYGEGDVTRLVHASEKALIRLLAQWPDVVARCINNLEPNVLTTYLQELAGGFHGYWTAGVDDPRARVVLADDVTTTKARLDLVMAVRVILGSGLRLLGITPMEKM